MTVFPNRYSPPATTDSSKPHERTSSSQVPGEKFRKLMQVSPVDKDSEQRGPFSLMEEEEEALAHATAPIAMTLQPGIIATTQVQNGVRLDEIQVLFEKMASAMVVMAASDESQTTLLLDNPDSPFFGTQITIREFSTAPKVFNIEIASNPAALAKIQEHQASLLATFQEGRFNFGVHRLDTRIQEQEDLPVFHLHEEEHKGGSEE